MTLDEALQEAVSGARMTAAHLDGVYVEHSFSRGFLRCWPVDRAEDEPNRSQCAFDPKPEDRAADWFELQTAVYTLDASSFEDSPHPYVSKDDPRRGIPIKDREAAAFGKRDKQAEALALMGKPVVVSDPVRDEIRKTIGPNICNDFGKWGVRIPGAKPVLDIDAPKRDSWGKILP